MFGRSKSQMVSESDALPGRDAPTFEVSGTHAVNGHKITPPFPDGHEVAIFAMGCFWGAERLFWNTPGVYATAVGYAGGYTKNPTYEETCSGQTGHTESVLVDFDPDAVSYRDLLQVFFDEHDATQENRQGNDVGTQYRSAIYYTTVEQKREAHAAADAFGKALAEAGKGSVASEITAAGPFYYAEEYHQQYLEKVPNGYCGLKGTGVTCALPGPSGDASADASSGSGASADASDNDPKLKPLPSNDDEWKARLSSEEYDVLRQAGTERAFTGVYNDADDDGMYRCMACGNPLFTSDAKFHSGCGWPSFVEAIDPDAVELKSDGKFGMTRTEVRCARCHSHLGHVFPDGPSDRGGQRYCMNSVSLDLEKA